MRSKPPSHLSEVVRNSPRNLVNSNDSGLIRENGDLIDLHQLLTKNSVQVRLVKIVTNTMRQSGLHHGGIAIVDRGMQVQAGNIVHVRFNGDEIMRKLVKRPTGWYLVADDPRVGELAISQEDTVEKLGVVTACISFT